MAATEREEITRDMTLDAENTVLARERFRKKNHYYYEDLHKFYAFHVPPARSVLDVGCGNGRLLSSVRPAGRVRLDASAAMIEEARRRHPECEFIHADITQATAEGTFDYVIISDTLESINDIQAALERIRASCHPG